jgi:hypothetical protein
VARDKINSFCDSYHEFSGSDSSYFWMRLLGQPRVTWDFTYQSGRYFNVLAGLDANHDGNPLTDRPLSVGRNTFLGQRFLQFNTSIRSRYHVSKTHEEMVFAWTVNLFNLFNRTNFTHYNTVLSRNDLTGLDQRIVAGRRGIPGYDFRQPLAPGGFGIATSDFSPRRIQLGLQFSF